MDEELRLSSMQVTTTRDHELTRWASDGWANSKDICSCLCYPPFILAMWYSEGGVASSGSAAQFMKAVTLMVPFVLADSLNLSDVHAPTVRSTLVASKQHS